MKTAVQWRTFVFTYFKLCGTATIFYLFTATVDAEKLSPITSEANSRSESNELYLSKSDERSAQGSHRASALSDICSYYGNQLLSIPQSARGQMHNKDAPTAGIWVTHDLFDTAFGLTPHLTYKVDVKSFENEAINRSADTVYILQASAGQFTEVERSSGLCDNHNHGNRRLVIFPSLPSKALWSVTSVTDSPYILKIWLTRYNFYDNTFTEVINNFTIFSECLLKLRIKHGTFTNLQLPWGSESSEANHRAFFKHGCRILWSVPVGSSVELTLRKLKMFKPDRRICLEDNQLQWAFLPSTDASNLNLEEEWSSLSRANWKTARSFCGKLQEHPKDLRAWRSTDPFVMMRVPGIQSPQRPYKSEKQSLTSFAVKFHLMGPCSNPLFTDHSKGIKFSASDLMDLTPDCSFRVHLPYGLRVQLTANLISHNDSHTLQNGKAQSIGNGDVPDNNLLLIQSGQCRIALQLEDVAGTKVECLHDGRAQFTFSSLTNILTFRALVVGYDEEEGNAFASNNVANSSVAAYQRYTHLEVSYTAIADLTLTQGCDEGIAVNENTCIFLVNEPFPWHEAEARCNEIASGGHLVAIANLSIQEAVDTLIINSVSFEPNKAYWIGASDQRRESHFEWSDGKSLSFSKWFTGWPHFRNYGIQPSDDGMSNQDCVEVRQSFLQPDNIEAPTNGLYWNDRDCSFANPFVCQKVRNSGENKLTRLQGTFLCNRTEELDRLRLIVVVQSPLFPHSYPSSTTCIVNLNAPQGFKIVLNFNHFDLEEEDDCNYDSVEVYDNVEASPKSDVNTEHWKRCGNWNTRLKLLRWGSITNRISIRFNSDGTHTSSGFEVTASLERNDLNCADENSLYQQGHQCFLIVPFPTMTWDRAKHACRAMQAELSLLEEDNYLVQYLLDQIHKVEQFKVTPRYWIGEVDRLELSVSPLANVTSECPSLHNNVSINQSLTMEPCSSAAGYICRILPRSNSRLVRNASIESPEGDVKSPNFPDPYSDDNHFQLHIKLPNASLSSERIMVHFKMVDLEFQEECLYDYVGLQSFENGPMKKICGRYTKDLEKLTFISETSEVWLTFHADFSVVGGGFHASWSSYKLFGCPSQQFHSYKGEFFSPNFPHSILPNMNCTFHIVAPERHRIWIKFLVLEIGVQNARSQLLHCTDDYIRVSWGLENKASLCGLYNLTRETLQWISEGSELLLQLISNRGTLGRGFHAVYRFEPIPTVLEERVMLYESSTWKLYPFNHPFHWPTELRHRVTYVTRPGFRISYTAADWLDRCDLFNFSTFDVAIQDFYGNNSAIDLCGSPSNPGQSDRGKVSTYESVFHTLTLEYLYRDQDWSAPLGRIEVLQDENYSAKLATAPESSPVEQCDPNPCQNDGFCKADPTGLAKCECFGKWRGIFCALTLCQLASACQHGNCVTADGIDRCACDSGYTGAYCDIPLAPCDLEPCGDRGKCVPTVDSFICQCNPWWQGPRCETRWQQVPYKPLSQRMLEEPFWLGLMTITIVLVIIAVVWCAKRHFADKFDRFVSEELERGKVVDPPMMDWSHGRQAGHRLSILEQNVTSRPISPQTFLSVPSTDATSHRHFLGWSSFRKPSLLSITSLVSPSQSHLSVGASIGTASRTTRNTRNRRGGRTFSLDDLFRLPKRSPSPCKLGSDNDVASQRREIERQQILQRLIASQIPNRNQTAKPGEMVAMTPRGRSITTDEHSTDNELAESTIQQQLTLDLKAEKKVTFARMMEAVKAERSSSGTDTSIGEDLQKSRESVNKGVLCVDYRLGQSKRKHRGWNSRRFWRSHNSNSSTQGSASDHDTQETTSSMVHYLADEEATGSSSFRKGHRYPRLSGRIKSNHLQQSSANDSLLSIIRNISGSANRTPSTPSSPQFSDYEISSSFPTPLSTPGSPAGSLEAISQVTIGGEMQVTVVDQSASQRNSRAVANCLATPHITLEIPSSNYGQFLSPIREVPTPLPSPSHTPLPSLRRPERVNLLASSPRGSPLSKECRRPSFQHQKEELHSSDESFKGNTCMLDNATSASLNEHRVRKSISITVPSVIKIQVESPHSSPVVSPKSSPVPSPAKTKPPPLNIPDSNFRRFENLCSSDTRLKDTSKPQLPTLFVSEASPDNEKHTQVNTPLTSRTGSPAKWKSTLNWDNVNIGSPPLRKHSMDAGRLASPPSEQRRGLKDTNDKSSSLELPQPPPMITVTKSFSELESDTDPPMLGRSSFDSQSKMSYLSPFVCYNIGRAEIAASESNLSSSGYSSMASPGPSPSCSSRALSILEEDFVLHRLHPRKRQRGLLSRTLLSPSLESSSSPPDSPPEQNLNTFKFLGHVMVTSDSDRTDVSIPVPQIQVDDLDVNFSYHSSDAFAINSDIKDDYMNSRDAIEPEEAKLVLDDAKKAEYENNPQGVRKLKPGFATHSFKSVSLDSKLTGTRRSNIKSDSLDTKLQNVQSSTGHFSFGLHLPDVQPLRIPETSEDHKRGSPVSSRSESPLSDARNVGLERFSSHFYGMSRTDVPYTDSDGLYDYPSSETMLPRDASRRMVRKFDRRRDRRAALKISNKPSLTGNGKTVVTQSLLDPNSINRSGNRLTTLKRRVRAHHINFQSSTSSSSSDIELSQKRRGRKNCSPKIFTVTSDNSPKCDVVLTIQAASSPEVSSEGDEKYYELPSNAKLKKGCLTLKKHTRSMADGQCSSDRRRMQDGPKKRRDHPGALHTHLIGRKRSLLSSSAEMHDTYSTTSTSTCQSDYSDTDESLANLTEIDESVDASPS